METYRLRIVESPEGDTELEYVTLNPTPPAVKIQTNLHVATRELALDATLSMMPKLTNSQTLYTLAQKYKSKHQLETAQCPTPTHLKQKNLNRRERIAMEAARYLTEDVDYTLRYTKRVQ